MTKIIRVRAGDRLALKVGGKGKRRARPVSGGRRSAQPGALGVDDETPRYIRRKKAGFSLSFFDIGTRLDGEDYVTLTATQDDLSAAALNALMLGDLELDGSNALRLPYHSEYLFTDAGDSETLFVLGAPDQRPLVADIVAGTPLSTGTDWTSEARLKLATKTRLVVASLTYFVDLDTSDLDRCKVTAEASYASDAVPFELTGNSARVFLVPAIWSWIMREEPGPGDGNTIYFRVPTNGGFAEPWSDFGELINDGFRYITVGGIPAGLKTRLWNYLTTEVAPSEAPGLDHFYQNSGNAGGYVRSEGQLVALVVNGDNTFWVWSIPEGWGDLDRTEANHISYWTEEISG